MNYQERVYTAVSSIPRGKVITYGQVAKLSGLKSPRVVGSFLHKNPDPKNIPCHRVVTSKGQVADTFAFGGAKGQIIKLESDGVEVKNNKVNLGRYLYLSKSL